MTRRPSAELAERRSHEAVQQHEVGEDDRGADDQPVEPEAHDSSKADVDGDEHDDVDAPREQAREKLTGNRSRVPETATWGYRGLTTATS